MSEKMRSKERSKSEENFPTIVSRYLPDGKLNIAARWNSPGPKYLLPSCTGFLKHDPTLDKRPAYTISNRLNYNPDDSKSPGPIYLPLSNVTNTGRIKSSSGYITSRPKEYGLWIGPGPADYRPENYRSKTMGVTIGVKHAHLDIPTHPVGPNKYNLPNTIGNVNLLSNIKTAPKYSISNRNKFMSTTYGMDDSPSHLYYPSIDQIKSKPPKWTIAGRNYLPEMDKTVPGPSHYQSEQVKVSYKRAPAVSLGIRHSEFCSTGFSEKSE